MRTIDADALENAIDKEREILIEQGRPGAEHIVVHHARRLIEDAPTVDAIPVELLKDWMDMALVDDDIPMEIALSRIFKRWKKEQEAR